MCAGVVRPSVHPTCFISRIFLPSSQTQTANSRLRRRRRHHSRCCLMPLRLCLRHDCWDIPYAGLVSQEAGIAQPRNHFLAAPGTSRPFWRRSASFRSCGVLLCIIPPSFLVAVRRYSNKNPSFNCSIRHGDNWNRDGRTG